MVAVPSDVVYSTVTISELGPDKVTVKTALTAPASPSATNRLLIRSDGSGSDGIAATFESENASAMSEV
jgi:hypothetical protein